MFDEIDKFQDESDFRSELENCLDYFRHPSCKGCLVSATDIKFSDRKLNKLPRTIIEKVHPEFPNVNLYRIQNQDDILKFIFMKIHQTPSDKFLVAYKPIRKIQSIVKSLDIKSRGEIRILCGEGSRESIGESFGRIEKETLPGRINFMTSAYFSGVDIEEEYHLIMISDTSSPFSLLSISEIRQIIGRCRSKMKSINLIIPIKKERIPLLTKKDLKGEAEKLIKAAQLHSERISKIRLDPVTFIKNKRHQITMTMDGVQLIRLDRSNKYRISSFTVDHYLNRNKQLRFLYGEKRTPEKSLSEFFIISTPKLNLKDVDIDNEVKKSFLETLLSSGSLVSELLIANETENRIFARYKICLQLIDHADCEWIVSKRYFQKTTFRKEYIKRYMSNFPMHSQLWKEMEKSFVPDQFYSWDYVRDIVSKNLMYLTDKIDVTVNDHIPILNGFFDIYKTTSAGANGIKIKSINIHNRFAINQSDKIKFDEI